MKSLGLICGIITFSAPAAAASATATATATDADASGKSSVARATLSNAEGKKVGNVEFEDAGEKGVRIQVRLHGLPPGHHAFHIHEKGSCEAPDFKSAGGHFNPDMKSHGLKNTKGPHAGDMVDLVVNQRGTARKTYFNHRITLEQGKKNSLFHEGGTAVVVHAGQDDQRSDPAGNAGSRIACGVVK